VEIKDKIPLNFELMGNPINWVILLLMVAIAGLAVHLIFSNPSASSGET
jgi:hypothetical protein